MIQVIIGCVGVFALENSQALGCQLSDGETTSGKWLYFKNSGNIFATLHILAIIVQTASINASLYKVPKKFGVFSPPTPIKEDDNDAVITLDASVKKESLN